MSISDSISRDIADISASIISMGLSPELYVPDLGVGEDEAEAYENPFLPQLLAALQIFARLFCGTAKKAWAHLAAEMQAGKTGVVCGVLRLILRNIKTFGIRPERVFLITGMNDNAWTKQTRERVPEQFRKNVHHNGNLKQVKEKLIRLAKGEYLKNCLVVLDESHFASSYDNRPAKEVFETLHSLCPIELWAERNVRLVTISATDPALTIGIADQRHIARDIRLQTTAAYQSVESLEKAGRLIDTFALKDDVSLRRYIDILDKKFGTEPLYHILRPQRTKNAWVQETLKTLCPSASVIAWDSSTSSKHPSSSDGSSTASIEDINEILQVRPTKITFIVIKDMFYASKTLCDKHVGALYDRCGGKDDTNLQSLLGRACGYGKSKRTIVFTSLATVSNYLKFWRDIATSAPIQGTDAKALSGKMAGVVASETGLEVASSRAMPVVKKDDAPVPLPKAADTDKDHRVFDTQEEAIAFAVQDLGKKFNRRTASDAPKELLVDGKNPSVDTLVDRMWGLNVKNPARLIPSTGGQWCVYWRPSLIKDASPAPVTASVAPAPKTAKTTATASTTDKTHRVFDTQEGAIVFARDTLKKKFNRRSVKEEEEVPTVEAGRKGLNEKHYAKMVPAADGKWCVHWIPSLVPK